MKTLPRKPARRKRFYEVIVLKKRILALCLLAALLLSGCQSRAPQASGVTVVASFYPVYTALLQVADGVPGVTVSNLTAQSGGCLHDYALTTADLKALSHADLLLINGAGMEPFMDKIRENLPALRIVDTSAELTLLGDNPHVWMSIENYRKQLEAIRAALAAAYPEQVDAFSKNAAAYDQKLAALQTRADEALAPFRGKKIVTFHEAFDYLAQEFRLTVAARISHDEHSAPTPNEIKNTILLMQNEQLTAIFTEPDNADSTIDSIAGATGAAVYSLDPVTAPNGAPDRDAYLAAMEQNIETLKNALS